MMRKVIPITGIPTHHFFSVDPDTFLPNVMDRDGAILVFTDRAAAEAEARRRAGPLAIVAVVGMGDAKWGEFQRSERFRVVET